MDRNGANGAGSPQGGAGYSNTPQQGGYANMGTGYQPQQGGYANMGTGYQPQQSGYANMGTGYQPQQSGYASMGTGYQPQQSGYANMGTGYQPQQSGYASMGTGYQPQQGGYASMGTGYQPQQSGYANMGTGYQPQQSGYASMGAGYMPQTDAQPGADPEPSSQPPAQEKGYRRLFKDLGNHAKAYKSLFKHNRQDPPQPEQQVQPQQAPQSGYAAMNPTGYQQQSGYAATNQTGYQPQGGYAAMNPTGFQPQGGYAAMNATGYQPQGGYAAMGQAGGMPPQPPQNDPPAPPPQPEPDPQPEERETGKKAKERPKEKLRLNRIQIVVIVAAVVMLAVYLTVTFMPARANFATIQAGMLGARYSGDALIVRNETPYVAEGVTSIEYEAEEGKDCQRGMAICNVYSSGYSTKEITNLQDYRNQIRDYQLSLLNSETTYDARMARVETEVLNRAKEVRSILAGARGNLNNQEKLLSAAVTGRQQYLKTKYADDQRMSRLYDDERAQQQRINSWTKQYAATADAIVSFYSDGYEYGLTVGNFETFTPAEVRRMIRGEKPAGTEQASKGKTTIYRTIRDGSWNVLFLVKDQNWNPVEGQMYELQLENFRNTTVQARVLSFTRSGGELLVRLSVDSSVTPVLYMRTCTAELGDYVSTMMVPSRAIYTQDEMQGVVIVEGSVQSFVPVQVVYRNGDDVYVSPITQGLLYEGQTVRLF